MITVIIPALNEEKTIALVVNLANSAANVSQVIVVDDMSMDNTVPEARAAGATVITSTKLGKGTSMKDGLLVAKNEIIVFLDADITTYPENVVDLLAQPLIDAEADFVKAYFNRQAGRVTELVAKPLLSILYPAFPNFRQPLSGMIAGKKTLLSSCEFEEGYGVDIGILIDMYHLGANIKEVSIGNIENRMRPLDQLGKMSREVAGTIIRKSKGFDVKNLETYENIQMIRGQMEFAIREGLMSLKKVAVFALDNVVLQRSFMEAAAERLGFSQELAQIATGTDKAFLRTKLAARLLKGSTIGELLEIADSIPVPAHLQEVVARLNELGYITGIISDGYSCITNHFRNRFGFSFTIANELEFSKSVATGEVTIPSLFLPDKERLCEHDYCKMNALIRVCGQYGVDIKNTIAIGGSESDICMVSNGGIGISFCSANGGLDAIADYIIKVPDFDQLTSIIN